MGSSALTINKWRRACRTAMLVVLLGFAATASADQPVDTYANPLDVHIADPFVFRENDTYHMYGTGSGEGFVVYTSEDLVNWTDRGHAFRRDDDTWSQMHFWAPEMFEHKGKYYLHFTAVGGEDFQRRVVLAQGDSPLGPFKEIKAPWIDPGHETIDTHVFRDDDGTLYVYAVQIQSRPFEIHARTLDPETMEPSKESTLCIKPSQLWEGGWVNEGPFVTKRGDTYLMTYSANGYENPNYSVGLAIAKSPMGPWEKPLKGPILRRAGSISGPGHHSFAESPDGSELFIVYHTHRNPRRPSGARQVAIDRARYVDEGEFPSIEVHGPTETPQPMPSGAPPLVRGQDEEFDQPSLDRDRWTIFNEDPDSWALERGRLVLRTHDGDIHQERADASNIFLQYAPHGDFAATTRVRMRPARDYEQAFLVLWQDHHHFAKLALVHSEDLRFEIGVETDGRYDSQLHDLPFGIEQDVWLQVRRTGDRFEFRVSADGDTWHSLGERKLPLFDLRVGIGAVSPVSGRTIPAEFDFLRFSKAR